MMILAASSGGLNAAMTVGSYNDGFVDYYGYSAGAGAGVPTSFGTLTNTSFRGATVLELYRVGSQCFLSISGDQTGISGFLRDVTVDGVSLGAIPLPTYSGSYTQWDFSSTAISTLGGTVQNVVIR